jgi:hypothetical protein
MLEIPLAPNGFALRSRRARITTGKEVFPKPRVVQRRLLILNTLFFGIPTRSTGIGQPTISQYSFQKFTEIANNRLRVNPVAVVLKATVLLDGHGWKAYTTTDLSNDAVGRKLQDFAGSKRDWGNW